MRLFEGVKANVTFVSVEATQMEIPFDIEK